MAAAFRCMLRCYIFYIFVCLSEAYVAENCSIQGHVLLCTKTSGKFLQDYGQSNLSSLVITYSNITSLDKDDFLLFSNLTTISISNSTISFPVQDNLFSRIQNLTDLYIMNTDEGDDTFKLFSENLKIRKLKLNHNKITELRKIFVENQRLIEEMDLSNNEIVHIEERTFDNFSSLKKLNLTNNRIGNSYDPTYVSLGSIMCAVCRPDDTERVCTNNDFNNCLINKGVDLLWWISNSINIQLENNPICLAVSENSNVTYNTQNNTNVLAKDHRSVEIVKTCRVYEYGYCYKHESRRMFLLEVCGVDAIFPSPIFQRHSIALSQSKLVRSNTTEKSYDDESWNLEKILLNASLPSLFVSCLGIIILAAVIGSLATYLDLERNKKIDERRSKNRIIEA